MDITKNELLIVSKMFKSPEKEYNANSISKELNITPMGALKILKRLEKENILDAKVAGKATFYRINFSNDYARDYMGFVLKREAEHSSPYVKRWVTEVRKLKNADIAIVFGSVLKKEIKADDVDVLIITDQKMFEKLKDEIKELNQINEKEMHAIFQSSKDLKDNILRRDAIVLNALKGIVVFGEEKLIELIK